VSLDLSTTYLGLDLRNPLVASSSPLTRELDTLRRLEDAGTAAVVLPSLFEEQIEHEELAIYKLHEFGTDSFPEALDYFPELDSYNTGPEAYLRLVEQARSALEIPVIGSLNGSSKGGWTRYARLIQEAGADALELNVYFVTTDPEVTSHQLEQQYLELVSSVRDAVSIPLSVKIGPNFASPAHMARQLVDAGADGLVLFNRFLRPDIDLEHLRLEPALQLTDSYQSRLPLQWIAILRDRLTSSLAATSGVHTADDALKLLLAGADVVMLASSLLRRGSEHVRTLLTVMREWMEEREYVSVRQLQGSMSLANCPDPSGYERANYMRALVSYTGEFI
jgi:dihydroorotate dehydrogenase (fumarate)